jgi:hypothetical protein
VIVFLQRLAIIHVQWYEKMFPLEFLNLFPGMRVFPEILLTEKSKKDERHSSAGYYF